MPRSIPRLASYAEVEVHDRRGHTSTRHEQGEKKKKRRRYGEEAID
jgi:hypothetical protein